MALIDNPNIVMPPTEEAYCLVGCIYLKPAQIPQVKDMIKVESLIEPELQKTWLAIMYVYDMVAGEEGDDDTFQQLVIERLEKHDKYTRAEAINILLDITDYVGAPGTAEYHARRVAEYQKQCDLVRVNEAITKAVESGGSVNGELAKARQTIDDIMNFGERGARLDVVCLDDVEEEEVTWMWPGRFPSGKLSVITGDPGLGKSFATIDIASRITTGRAWPDAQGINARAGSVLWLCAEDGLGDTIKPRMVAARANCKKVTILQGVRRPGERTSQQFDLHTDIDVIERQVATMKDCRLVIIDPISAYLGKADSYKDAEVRAVLAPLGQMAERLDTSVLAVMHLNKSTGGNAIHRTGGSIAFVAAPRAVWLVALDPDDPTKRVFANIKMNIAAPGPALAFQITSDQAGRGVVGWIVDQENMMTADQLLTQKGGARDDEDSALTEAGNWLLEELKNGDIAVSDLKKMAKDAGISWAAIRRAKAAVGVRSTRSGFGHGGVWHFTMTPSG